MSTHIDIDGYQPAYLSYSTVNSYRFCPKSFQLGKIKRVEQRPGWAAIGGNAVHRATELLDLAEFERGNVDNSGDDPLREALRSWGQEEDK